MKFNNMLKTTTLRTITLALLSIMATGIKAQDKTQTTLTATVSGIPANTCRWFVEAFPMSPMEDYVKRDTLNMKQGTFTYTLKGDTLFKVSFTPETAVNHQGKYEDTDLNKVLELYMVPGKRLQVKGSMLPDRLDYEVTGPPLSRVYAERTTAYRKANGKKLHAIYKAFTEQSKDSASLAKLNKEYFKIEEAYRQSNLAYAKAHPTEDIAAAYYVENAEDSLFAADVHMFPSSVRNGIFKNAINERLRVYDIVKGIRDNQGKVQLGTDAPDFSFTTIDGKKVSLKTFGGRQFLVLDFWGSWCRWCIRGVPDMKKYYAKYKGKFEILGVDCNDKKDKMLSAIKTYQMNWLHIINNDKGIDDNLVLKYAVQAFPTKIIISPAGKIVGYFEGEEETFYQKLDELLK